MIKKQKISSKKAEMDEQVVQLILYVIAVVIMVLIAYFYMKQKIPYS